MKEEYWEWVRHEGDGDIKMGVCAECERSFLLSHLCNDLCEGCDEKKTI